MGYKRFRELIVSITSSKATNSGENNNEENSYGDLQPGDSQPAIIQKIANTNIQSIEDTISVLDVLEVQKAIKGIQKARRLCFFWPRSF